MFGWLTCSPCVCASAWKAVGKRICWSLASRAVCCIRSWLHWRVDCCTVSWNFFCRKWMATGWQESFCCYRAGSSYWVSTFRAGTAPRSCASQEGAWTVCCVALLQTKSYTPQLRVRAERFLGFFAQSACSWPSWFLKFSRNSSASDRAKSSVRFSSAYAIFSVPASFLQPTSVSAPVPREIAHSSAGFLQQFSPGSVCTFPPSAALTWLFLPEFAGFTPRQLIFNCPMLQICYWAQAFSSPAHSPSPSAYSSFQDFFLFPSHVSATSETFSPQDSNVSSLRLSFPLRSVTGVSGESVVESGPVSSYI